MKQTNNQLINNYEEELVKLSNKLNYEDKLEFNDIKNKVKNSKFRRYFMKLLPGHLIVFFVIILFINISGYLRIDLIERVFIFIAVLLTSFTFLNNKKQFQIVWMNFLIYKNYIKLDELESFIDAMNVIKRAQDFLNDNS